MHYQQSRGALIRDDGRVLAYGYSGNGAGLNRPEMQTVPRVGPIPQGMYVVGPAEDSAQLGPVAMPLHPAPTNLMYGRSGFFIHGDNDLLNHTASEGCIILPHEIRVLIAAGTDRLLTVIA